MSRRSNGLYVIVATLAVLVAAVDGIIADDTVGKPKTNAVQAALKKRMDFGFGEATLNQIVMHLKEQSGIDIRVDQGALEEEGIGGDLRATLLVRDIRLASGLNHLVREFGLVAVAHDDHIEVTTRRADERSLVVRMHPVRDLVAPRASDGESDIDSLIEAVIETTEPDRWDDLGGPGSIAAFDDVLIVSQSRNMQMEIERLLNALRRAKKIAHAPKLEPPSVISLSLDARAPVIDDLLAKQVAWEFKDTQLTDVLESISDRLLLDRKALDTVGIKPTTKLTFKLKGVPFRYALAHLLRDLELTWIRRDEAIVITTPEEAERELEMRVYPVADLITADDPLESSSDREHLFDYDSLIELITTVVAPANWDEVGGPGQIDGIYGALLIPQSREVHEQVEFLLAALRELRRQHKESSHKIVSTWIPAYSTRNQELAKKLDATVLWKAKEESLAEFAATLSSLSDLPVLIDKRALEWVGLDEDLVINSEARDQALCKTLDEILRKHELTWFIFDEVLMISTPEACESVLRPRVYPAYDMLASRRSHKPPPFWFGRWADPADLSDPADALVDSIQTTLAPETWDEVGGPGSASLVEYPAALVVSQTPQVNRELVDLLDALRTARKAQAPSADPPLPANAKPKLHRHIYRIILDEKSQPLVTGEEAANLIRKLIEPESWKQEGVLLEHVRVAVIVRHHGEVHYKIMRLLNDIGVLDSWPTSGGLGPGGFQ